jgi:DNA repair protein RecO (recombination protein O)
MSSEKATAIVLRVIEFSESSSIVTLFTREFGKIRALAKGARRPKGPFESALDLLGLCRIVFLRKSTDALDLLTEAKLERRFRPAGGDLSNLYAAYYVAELLNALTDDYDPHLELFDAADETLAALRTSSAVAPLLLRFELTALRVLGHLPLWETCAECGTPVKSAGRVPFSPLVGGVLCKSCRVGQKQVISVSAGVLQALVRFAEVEGDAWRGLELEARTYGELRAVLNHYWAHLLGHPPRMHRYLGTTAS